VMLGFKRFRCAKTTISGIELMHRIRKGQFNLRTLGLRGYYCTRRLECCPIQ
jgi:transposase-like protein